jgi:hypothetical protein
LSMSRPSPPAGSMGRPTLDTRFCIDYNWWEESGQDLRVHMQQICEEYGQDLDNEVDSDAELDWIDPVTGQVWRVDRLTYTFRTTCGQHPDFITERTSLIDAVFRTLLASGNRPMTPVELSERTGRSADMILRTLSGRTVYKGIRPYNE